MNLWIGEETGSKGRELRLEGRLAGDVVAELERVARSGDPLVRIYLDRLSFADAAGIEILRRLASQGVELVGARPLIAYRLQEDGPETRSNEVDRTSRREL